MTKNRPKNQRRLQLRHAKNQQGSSLIEVLVSVFIMAIGLLGLAALQANNLKNINNSQFRTLAATYAYDMAERMRSNRTAALAGEYTEDCSSDDCKEWKLQISQDVISGGLPTGSGEVTQSGNLFTITVEWDEQVHHSSGESGDADFTLSLQL